MRIDDDPTNSTKSRASYAALPASLASATLLSSRRSDFMLTALRLYLRTPKVAVTTISPKHIDPEELAAIIKSEQAPNKDYCIIDVRDDDWRGGNIKGARNSPSHNFLFKVYQLVKDTEDIPLVVFHCSLSQSRGPKAATIYTSMRLLMQIEKGEIPHQVMILRGGFSDFQAKFSADPQLVEKWEAEVWAPHLSL